MFSGGLKRASLRNEVPLASLATGTFSTPAAMPRRKTVYPTGAGAGDCCACAGALRTSSSAQVQWKATRMSLDRISLEDDLALREGAGIGAVSPRGQIAVAGKDRASYLQGLLTNDIQALTAGTGCYAAWLTPQGRMITDVHVLESGDMILLDVPAELVDAILERLDHFLFSEDVQFASLVGALRPVGIHGPAAARALAMAITAPVSFDNWSEYQHGRFEFA